MDKRIFILMAAMVFSCGCVVQSINPFYTNDLVIQLPQLTGTWDLVSNGSQSYKPKETKPWSIDKDRILTFDDHGLCAPFTYKVFKIDNDTLLDVIPTNDREGCVSQYWLMSVAPVHLLFKLDINGGQLILTPLNYEWFQAKQKFDQLTLPMITATGEDWGIFNAKSQEWIDFLKKYKNGKNFFKDDSKIVLKHIKTP